MQDILSFVQVTTPVTLAPSSMETLKNESSDGSFSESFFSMILGQITQENEETLLSELTLQEAPTTPILELAPSEQEAKSIDEHLLEDLLSVVNALQQDPQTTTFPTLNASPTLEKLMASEATRQEFASVKSVSDLMNLSQKYNLGLEKISISQESLQSLQTKFPSLAENNFFDDLQNALTNTQTASSTSLKSDTTLPQTPTTTMMSLLTKQPEKSETAVQTTSMLSELISKEIKTEPKIETKTTQSVSNATNSDDMNLELENESLIVNEKQQTTQPKAVLTSLEEVMKAVTTPVEITTQKVVNSNEIKKIETAPLADDVEEVTTEEPVKILTARTSETEIEKSFDEESLQNVLKSIKPEKQLDGSVEEEILLTQKITTHEEIETTNSSSASDEISTSVDVRNDVKTTLKQDITSKTATVKESLNQFASDLKEKIEAYKPPIMKVELALSPKNLGEVDVTLLTRGNNLHVNISSNSTAMNLFTQNQAEVKNALINMGFTNLEMNFSDQRNSEQQPQQNQKQSYGNFEEFTSESNEEETALLEIVIPQYV